MTLAIKTIVCATDFSETASRAVEYAKELTDKFDAELHLLHVIHDYSTEWPTYGDGVVFPGYLEHIGEKQEDLEVAALNKLHEQLPAEWQKTHKVALAVQEGKQFVEIVRFARDVNADLIVIGTHGRGMLAHALLGSVAEKIVQKAPCPVLTVKPEGHEYEAP
jgi:nucleotide-binding universal stress UspA family protein